MRFQSIKTIVPGGAAKWLAVVCGTLAAAFAQAEPITALGESGYFRVTAQSELDPIPINQMHSWVLQVATAAGVPVEDAQISVGGGMPDHDHGLPTAPRVTTNLKNGSYLLEGIRFHMNGRWEISIAVVTPERRDVVVLELEL